MEKAVKDWLALGPEDRLKTNSFYKRHYEDALYFAKREGPAWEDLTHEEREKVRDECIRYQQEASDFGKTLGEKK